MSYCTSCDRTGYISCYSCQVTGSLTCFDCHAAGKKACVSCRGDRQFQRRVQCTKCDSEGYLTANNVRTPALSLRTTLIEEFNTNDRGWYTINTPSFRSGVQDGGYVMQCNSTNLFFSVTEAHTRASDNYTISVYARHVAGVIDYGYGLCFSFLDPDNYYGFYIADGYYKLFRRRHGKQEDLIAWTKTDALKRGAGGNLLKVEKRGDVCWLFLNDTYVNKVFNYYEIGANIGALIENYQTVVFDNFRVLQ